MAGELRHLHSHSEANIYALLWQFNEDQVRDVVAGAWETFSVGSLGDYDIAYTETPASSRRYQADMPAGVLAGDFTIEVFERAGGSPAITDTLLARQDYTWDGTDLEPLAGSGNVTIVSGPGDADLCEVYGYLRDGMDRPVQGRAVVYTIQTPPQTTSSSLIETEPVIVRTGADGHHVANLIREKDYRVEIIEAGVDAVITIPGSASVDLRELL
jgi:hypothetical protein